MRSIAIGICAAGAVVLSGAALRPLARVRPLAAAPVRAQRPWMVALIGVLLPVVVVTIGPLVAAAAVVGVVFVRRWRAVRARTLRQRAIDAAYPDALDLVVLAVRAGFLPSAAIEVVTARVPAAVRPAFAAVSARIAGGERFADALAALDELGPTARALIDTFAAADRYGLALAPVLERLAFEARQQRRRAADAAARQLPVRLSLPLVLCTLPSFVLLAIVPLLLGAFSSLHTS